MSCQTISHLQLRPTLVGTVVMVACAACTMLTGAVMVATSVLIFKARLALLLDGAGLCAVGIECAIWRHEAITQHCMVLQVHASWS